MPRREELLRFHIGDQVKSFVILDKGAAGGRSSKNKTVAEPLGEGGSGSVFLAEQFLFGGQAIRRVIKFFLFRNDIAGMRDLLGKTPISEENFATEIAALSTLTHKNLVRIIDADKKTVSGKAVPYIVYDYIRGQTLRELDFRSTEVATDPRAVTYKILELCEGVAYLHRSGYHHYDIAPKNVFCNADANNEFVLGDLGLARRHDQITGKNFVIGSKEWVPPRVAALMDQEVDEKTFKGLQPAWDVYGLAKTIEHYLRVVEAASASANWTETMLGELRRIQQSPDRFTVDDLARRVRFASPISRETAGVPELSPGLSEKQIMLMPVHALVTTKRVQRLAESEGMKRLMRVPQLTAAYMHFPSTMHTRYEHSLGVMEVMRRYLISIIQEGDFLSHLSETHIETCLLAALLSNAHQFCFTNIINDVRIPDKWTDKLNKRAILKVVFSYHGEGGASISDVMTQFFPRVNIEHLMDLLTGATRDESDVLIHSMLNSSIDARVVDYIARDSYHLGIRGDSPVENEEIFQFVGVHRNRIALNVRGLAAAEQIIAQRYWLFSRFYWNRPNRRYASVLRTAFLGLSTTSNFLDTFVDDCLNLGFDDTLYYIEQKLSESHQEKLVDLSRFLMNRRSAEYIIRFDHNLTDIHELSGTFTKIDEMGAEERYALDQRISRELFGSDESCHGVMLDLPRENGKMKFGEDVIVMFKKGENSENTIASTSPIVGGIRESYDKQLRRLRLFVHPKVNALYEKTDVEDMFREFLITRL